MQVSAMVRKRINQVFVNFLITLFSKVLIAARQSTLLWETGFLWECWQVKGMRF